MNELTQTEVAEDLENNFIWKKKILHSPIEVIPIPTIFEGCKKYVFKCFHREVKIETDSKNSFEQTALASLLNFPHDNCVENCIEMLG